MAAIIIRSHGCRYCCNANQRAHSTDEEPETHNWPVWGVLIPHGIIWNLKLLGVLPPYYSQFLSLSLARSLRAKCPWVSEVPEQKDKGLDIR